MPRINSSSSCLSAKTLVILWLCVSFSESSSQTQKKDSPTGQTELVKADNSANSNKTLESKENQPSQFPAIITKLSSNITLNLQDQEASASSTPKLARHLGFSGKNPNHLRDKLVLGMIKMSNEMKRPLLRSRIMGGGRPGGVRIFKAIPGPPGGDGTRYAPRSLDMGLGNLINYNPVENYGNLPSLLPTSSSPNSLDHLYLPEMSVKDYMKPLDMNGIGHFPGGNEISHAIPYADGFHYNNEGNKGLGGGPPPAGGFRGNPVDESFHGSGGKRPGHNPLGPPEHFHGAPRGPPTTPGGEFSPSSGNNSPHTPHHHHQQRHSPHGGIPDGPPPRPPHGDQSRGSPKFSQREEGEDGGHRFPEGPPELPPPPPLSGNPGASEIQGDEGLWNILDLANLLQNSQGLTQSLSGVNSLAGVGGGEPEGSGEREGGPPNHFDAPSPGAGPTHSPPHDGEGGPRGGRYSDGPNSSGENNYGSYDGPPDRHPPPPPHGDGPHGDSHQRYNNPHHHNKGKYGKPGTQSPHHFNGDEGGGPPRGGGDSGHYNEYNDQGPSRPGGGGHGGRGKPGHYNNNNYDGGPDGHSPEGSHVGMHGRPPPNPYKGDNDYNSPNGSDRHQNGNRGAHGPGSPPGPGHPNQFDEHVPNLDGNPGNDSPGPFGGPPGGGGDEYGGGGGEGGDYPGEGGPPEGYNTRDGPYDGYNSNDVHEYGSRYPPQGHPTNRPNSPSSTKPPHLQGGDGPLGGGFDEDGEENSQEQFDGPPGGHPHNHLGGSNDPGRGHGGEFPSDDYGGYD